MISTFGELYHNWRFDLFQNYQIQVFFRVKKKVHLFWLKEQRISDQSINKIYIRPFFKSFSSEELYTATSAGSLLHAVIRC